MIKAALSARQPLPDAIRSAPELLPGLDLYWQSYLMLARFRDSHGRIDLGTILRYAEWQELEPDQVDDLVYFTGELDATYQEWAQRQKS